MDISTYNSGGSHKTENIIVSHVSSCKSWNLEIDCGIYWIIWRGDGRLCRCPSSLRCNCWAPSHIQLRWEPLWIRMHRMRRKRYSQTILSPWILAFFEGTSSEPLVMEGSEARRLPLFFCTDDRSQIHGNKLRDLQTYPQTHASCARG